MDKQDKIDKVKQELKSNSSQLFDKAEKSIARAEKKRLVMEAKQKLEEEKALVVKREKTEEVANAILLLVHNTLTKSKYMSGKIKRVDKILGKLTDDGYSYDTRSGYSINNNGLTIVLDYSSDMDCAHGECFLGDSGFGNSYIYDFDYLKKILGEHNITISRKFGFRDIEGEASVWDDIITIELERQPQLSDRTLYLAK